MIASVSNMHQYFLNFQKVRSFVDQPEQKAIPNTLIKTEFGTKNWVQKEITLSLEN